MQQRFCTGIALVDEFIILMAGHNYTTILFAKFNNIGYALSKTFQPINGRRFSGNVCDYYYG